jgi:integrase
LLAELSPDRAARVAFIVATSASWGETESAQRPDVAVNRAWVLLRRTKRKTRYREVPIVGLAASTLIEYALRHAEGQDGMLFRPWANNVRRDIDAACARAGIPHCSPNDLRRTFATWMRSQGVPPHPIAPMMGHADSRMVERVYGRLSTVDLSARVAAALGATSTIPPNDCSAGVADASESPGRVGLDGQTASGELVETAGGGVLGPGIEPGTRGFSIRCSTS